MSLDEFGKLLGCGCAEAKFYILDAATKTAFKPGFSDIIWPVQYLLTCHPKHIYHGKESIDLPSVGRSLNMWEHRFRWSVVLRGQPQMTWKPFKVKMPLRPCEDHRLAPEAEEFISSVKSDVFQWAKRAKSRMQAQRHLCSNKSGVVKIALQALSRGAFCALPTDKDGGFCLVEKSDVADARSKNFARANYVRVEASESSIVEETWVDYKNLVIKETSHLQLEADDVRSLRSVLLSPWSAFSASLIGKLKFNVKTHKSAGDVSFRPIHSNTKSPLGAAMKFIMWCLQPALAEVTHLMRNSFQVKQALVGRSFPSSMRFAKIDIDDYYLSGEHWQFIASSVHAVDPKWKDLYRSLLKFCLASQYIRGDHDLYRVIVGAGMGVAYAGDLCDITFFWQAERGFVSNARVKQKLGIVSYFRYRDDILILVDGSSLQFHRFFKILQSKCGVWKLKVESISLDSVDFLDLHVQKSKYNPCRLEVGVFTKPTELRTALSPSSMHPISVHLAWPKGLAVRAARLCSTRWLNEYEMQRLHSFFAASSGTQYASAVLSEQVKATRSAHTHHRSSFIVLPYFRDYDIFGGLRSILAKHSQAAQALRLAFWFGFGLSLKLAFSNRSLHLQHRLERHRLHSTVDSLNIFT